MDNYKRFACQNGIMYRIGFDRDLSWSPVFVVFPNHLANETENRLTVFENTKLFFSPLMLKDKIKIKNAVSKLEKCSGKKKCT